MEFLNKQDKLCANSLECIMAIERYVLSSKEVSPAVLSFILEIRERKNEYL